MTTIAYKFLKAGGVGLISGFRWPKPKNDEPGAWVETTSPIRECACGVHACRAQDLSYWMYDELWAIELGGEVIEGVDMLVGSRGRLVRPLARWNRSGQTKFVEACRDRAGAILGHVPETRRRHADAFMGHMGTYLTLGWTQLGALCAALAIASTVDGDHEATKAVYRSERAWQSTWLVDHLGLALDGR